MYDYLHNDMTKLRFLHSNRSTLSEEKLHRYLSDDANIKWIQAGELLNLEFDSCVDGRERNPIVGNPGGDIVRLVEAIIAINEVTGRKFPPLEIESLFLWYLDHFGRFYMHTDDSALDKLRLKLAEDPRIMKSFKSVEELHGFITHLPKNFEQPLHLTRYLLDPEYVGCGHLKLMSLHPNRYLASIKVLRSLMMSFFDTLWYGKEEYKRKLYYPMLRGKHDEQAVLVVKVEEERVKDETWIPMIRPSNGVISMFVEHPQVKEYLALKIVQEIAEEWMEGRLKGQNDQKALYETMRNLQDEGLRETVSALAAGLPMYTVVINSDSV